MILKDILNTTKEYTSIDFFCGGGGSSMGASLAGFASKFALDIDERQAEIYRTNLKEEVAVMDIRDFNNDIDSYPHLKGQDLLMGSFPCTPFSPVNKSKTDISAEKKFREGQKVQRIDDLSLEVIKTATELQPKIVVLENVAGLMQKKFASYVQAIYDELTNGGYQVRFQLLDGSKMGVPQRRKRVFIIGIRNDIAEEEGRIPIHLLPLEFHMEEIPFKRIEEKGVKIGAVKATKFTKTHILWSQTKVGKYFADASSELFGKRGFLDYYKIDKDRSLPTITAHTGSGAYHPDTFRTLTRSEIVKASTFPEDYDFLKENPKYVCGMSVPPLMMKNLLDILSLRYLQQL